MCTVAVIIGHTTLMLGIHTRIHGIRTWYPGIVSSWYRVWNIGAKRVGAGGAGGMELKGGRGGGGGGVDMPEDISLMSRIHVH